MRLVVLAVLASAGVASPAFAQERLHLEVIGDDALHDTTVAPHAGGADDLQKPFARVGILAGTSGTLVPGGAHFLAPFAGVDVGLFHDASDFLQLHSEGALPISSSSPGLDWRSLEGRHRLAARVGVGKIEADTSGADLDLKAGLDHGDAFTTSFLRRDLPVAPFWIGSADATLSPRWGESKDDAVALPIGVGVTRARYDEGPRLGGYDAQRVSSAIAARFYADGASLGDLRVVGATWETIRFTDVAAAHREELQRIDLRFFDLDLAGRVESDMSLEIKTSIGGAWIWDPRLHDEISAFTFAAGAGMHVESDHGKESIGGGLAVRREAGFTASGELTPIFRLEGFLDATFARGHLGGSVRAATEQIPSRLTDGGFRSSITTEWWLSPIAPLELGAYHTATDRCPTALEWTAGSFCQQVGLFARVRAHAGPPIAGRVHDDDDDDKDDGAEPPPAPPPPPPPPELDELPMDLPDERLPVRRDVSPSRGSPTSASPAP